MVFENQNAGTCTECAKDLVCLKFIAYEKLNSSKNLDISPVSL